MRSGLQVLAILGSPRRNRFSERLADRFLEPLERQGCTVRKLRVSELNVRPCTGCDACRHTGQCVIRDDMTEVMAALDQADWVVLTSPVYFNSVTGALKVLIDRCQPYWARKFVLKLPPVRPGRRGFLLMSAGVKQTDATLDGSRRVADYFFKAQDIAFRDVLCSDRTDSADEDHHEGLRTQAAMLAEAALAEPLL